MRPHFRMDDIVVDVCGLHSAQNSRRPRPERCHTSTRQTLPNSQLVLEVVLLSHGWWHWSGALCRDGTRVCGGGRRAERVVFLMEIGGPYLGLGLLISLGVLLDCLQARYLYIYLPTVPLQQYLHVHPDFEPARGELQSSNPGPVDNQRQPRISSWRIMPAGNLLPPPERHTSSVGTPYALKPTPFSPPEERLEPPVAPIRQYPRGPGRACDVELETGTAEVNRIRQLHIVAIAFSRGGCLPR